MLRYALLRLLGAIPTLLLVIVLAFLMVHAAPGGPFDDERALPADVEANIAAAYHLDEPLPQQFLRYMTGLLQGDLGPSYRYRDYTVSELIGTAFPYSLKLGAMAMAGGSLKVPVYTAAWPTGETGPMGLEGAVTLGFKKELDALTDPAEREALFNQLVDEMYQRGKASESAAATEIDAVIDPAETRRVVLRALA